MGVVLCMLFLAGARLAHLGLIGGLAVPVVALAVCMAPYRLRRMLAFLDPWADPRGAGFQIIQSYLALGGGGLLGRGLGESKQKLFYLPEPHTDFIFAILGEELGFVGAVVMVGLFGLLLWRGLRVGLRVADPFGALLALGVTVLLATQAAGEPGRGGRAPAHEGAAAAVHLVRAARRSWWRWRAVGRAPQHLAAGRGLLR